MRVHEGNIDYAPTATEQYANAISHGSESSVVIAAAFSREEFGRRLVRLKFAYEAEEYDWCLRHITWVSLGKNRKWQADQSGVKKLAKQVLDYWIADTCPQCLGRGAIQIPDTPHLDETCPACINGIRKWESKLEWEARGQQLLETIKEDAARFGRAVSVLIRTRE